MGQPSIATIKQLFAVSGNRCAFPRCQSALVDPIGNRVIGKVCHIRANSEGGPRYSPIQADSDRQGFSNLLILCPIHHDVVDADTDAYTVERLLDMKRTHEMASTRSMELDERLAQQFISNASVNVSTLGPLVISVNQTGGQTAQSITNVGYQPKQIPESKTAEFLVIMKSVPPVDVHLSVNSFDSSTHFLANQLKVLLPQVGWRVVAESTSIGSSFPSGVIFEIPHGMWNSPSLETLSRFLGGVGFVCYRVQSSDECPAIFVN